MAKKEDKRIERNKTIIIFLFVLLAFIAFAIGSSQKTCKPTIMSLYGRPNSAISEKVLDCSANLYGWEFLHWQEETGEMIVSPAFKESYTYIDTARQGKITIPKKREFIAYKVIPVVFVFLFLYFLIEKIFLYIRKKKGK